MHENPKETRQCHNIPEHGRDTDRMLGDIWLFLQDVVLTQIPSTLLSFANCAHVAKYTFPSFSTNQYTCHTAPWYLSPSRSTHPFHNQNIISIASLEHRVVQSAFAMRHQVKLALVQTICQYNEAAAPTFLLTATSFSGLQSLLKPCLAANLAPMAFARQSRWQPRHLGLARLDVFACIFRIVGKALSAADNGFVPCHMWAVGEAAYGELAHRVGSERNCLWNL